MNSNRQRTVRIFVSHAAADREPARRAADMLSRYPNTRIFTAEMLSAGDDWRSKLKHELTESDVFAVVLSPEALESTLVLQEIGAAWALGKPVVLLLLDSDMATRVPLDVSAQYSAKLEDLRDPNVVHEILDIGNRAIERGPAAV